MCLLFHVCKKGRNDFESVSSQLFTLLENSSDLKVFTNQATVKTKLSDLLPIRPSQAKFGTVESYPVLVFLEHRPSKMRAT